ncbi:MULTISPECIES: hypothetical protein [Phyllobacteriaceae]|jgi:hypothetical protein|uniref:Uncharacterized protein n=1 Tax=Mesorhizobium hungaricum TaxID=1566387 RepID=A0A1C2E117_9HYPH|nr:MULTISPECIES: hypothetical protein [Mesorhizobium]MBN9235472.1 hypothetical protein [Mesorhizobium sp.]MDQ0331375.1 hypothetical protein [Mesorhizobium sp. YL-MeA3-2017]OCX20623.1 hypothetical protein QV13_08020 [Mesorhizobium hungaricum]
MIVVAIVVALSVFAGFYFPYSLIAIFLLDILRGLAPPGTELLALATSAIVTLLLAGTLAKN